MAIRRAICNNNRYMDKSSMVDSSIAEEQNIRTNNFQQQSQNIPQRKFKYANMKQVKNFQRLSQSYNQKIIKDQPTLFNVNISNLPIHLISNPAQEYFLSSKQKHDAQGTILKKSSCWEIKIPISNINQQSALKIQLAKMKSNRMLVIQNRQAQSGKTIRYKYSLTLMDCTLVLRVWVELEGIYKVWKEMEVPLTHDRVSFEICEFNNEQTDVRVNDYVFHLVLKMPYESESHYCLSYDETAMIEKIELSISSQAKHNQEMDTNCSKQCQLI